MAKLLIRHDAQTNRKLRSHQYQDTEVTHVYREGAVRTKSGDVWKAEWNGNYFRTV